MKPELPRPRVTRRAALALAGAVAALRPAQAALPATATLLIPGPQDGTCAKLAERLGVALARGGSGAVALRTTLLGGPDGVTAANRFATEAAPDGRMLLVLPGAAAQARLVGDPRARFEASAWTPVLAVRTTAAVIGREPPPGGPVRLALSGPEHAAAAALLGFELLGIAIEPVWGLPPGRAEAALSQGAVDAILLQGPDLSARILALQARAWFTLEPSGARDPAMPDIPSLLDTPPGQPALQAALQAATASLRLQAALVLPALTPADLVAQWRSAAHRWLEEENRGFRANGLRVLAGAEAAPLLASLTPPAAAQLAYRDWLSRRLNWRAE